MYSRRQEPAELPVCIDKTKISRKDLLLAFLGVLILFYILLEALLRFLAPARSIWIPLLGAIAASSVAFWLMLARIRAMAAALCGGGFCRPLQVTFGVFESYHYDAGRRSVYRKNFEEVGRSTTLERPIWNVASGYLVVKKRDWAYVRLPAYRIDDPCCKGLYVAALLGPPPDTEPVCLSATTQEGDVARGCAQVIGGVIHANLEFWKTKARSARLELEVSTPYGTATYKLVESAEHRAAGTLHVSSPVCMVVTPVEILVQDLPHHDEILWGLGPGARYTLKLTIDRPLARDVVVRKEFIKHDVG